MESWIGTKYLVCGNGYSALLFVEFYKIILEHARITEFSNHITQFDTLTDFPYYNLGTFTKREYLSLTPERDKQLCWFDRW